MPAQVRAGRVEIQWAPANLTALENAIQLSPAHVAGFASLPIIAIALLALLGGLVFAIVLSESRKPEDICMGCFPRKSRLMPNVY